jgi:undecaprenyl-diphosphatase
MENIEKKHFLKVICVLGIVWLVQLILYVAIGDEQLALALNGTEDNTFTTFIELYTNLLYVMIGGTALLTLLSMFVKKFAPFRQLFLSMWLSYAFTYIIIAPLKVIVNRKRPYESLSQIDNFGHDQDDASWPSGHSGYSAATMTPLALKIQKFYNIVVWPLFIIIHVIMMYSRAYLGVHWMTDLLCGSIIGALVSLAVVLILDSLYKKQKMTPMIEWILVIFCTIVSIFALI